MKKSLIGAVLGAALFGSACEDTGPKLVRYKQDERIRFLDGFGKVERINNERYNFSDFYKTSSGYYAGANGAMIYILNGKTGKLLTPGSHRVRLVESSPDGKFILQTGSDVIENDAPRTYSDFDDSRQDYIKERFEERADGLYLRNWK